MKILVWGCGAIGGSAAAYWSLAGFDVAAVDAQDAHVRAINERGLRVYGPLGERLARVSAFLPDAVRGAFDCIILAVKSDQTESCAKQAAHVLAPDGLVVSFQNGLNELVIAPIIGAKRTVGAFVNWSAEYMEPGTIWLGGLGALVLGELDGKITPRLEALLPICKRFNPNAKLSANIMGYLWGKLIYGSFLRITALADLSIVAGLQSAACRSACIRQAREIIAVADRHGVALQDFDGFDPQAFRTDVPASTLDKTFAAMIAFNATSEITHASVWRDLAVRHRRTDTRAQFEPLLHLAERDGVPTPEIRALIDTIEGIESGAIPIGEAALAALEQKRRANLHGP